MHRKKLTLTMALQVEPKIHVHSSSMTVCMVPAGACFPRQQQPPCGKMRASEIIPSDPPAYLITALGEQEPCIELSRHFILMFRAHP